MYNINDLNPERANSFNNIKLILHVLKDIILSRDSSAADLIEKVTALETAIGSVDSQGSGSGIKKDIYDLDEAIQNIHRILFENDPESVTEAIDTWQEIVNFLNSVEETTLNGILAKFVRSEDIKHIVTLSKAEYDALVTKDVNTEYNII